MGGEIEEIGVRLATKLGEKGIKSEINLKKKKKKKDFGPEVGVCKTHIFHSQIIGGGIK